MPRRTRRHHDIEQAEKKRSKIRREKRRQERREEAERRRESLREKLAMNRAMLIRDIELNVFLFLTRNMSPEQRFREYLEWNKELEEVETFRELIRFYLMKIPMRHYFRNWIRRRIEWRVLEYLYRNFFYSPVVKMVVQINVWTESKRDAQFYKEFQNFVYKALDNMALAIERKAFEISTTDTEPYWVKFFAEQYVPFMKERRCRSQLVALKITPLSFRLVKDKHAGFFVSRYTPIFVIRMDAYIGSSLPRDMYLVRMAWAKYLLDLTSLRLYGGEGAISMDTPVVTARDNLRRPYLVRTIRDLVFRPYTAVHDFARAVGKPESWKNIDHCSLYAVFGRTTNAMRMYRRLNNLDDFTFAKYMIRGKSIIRRGILE